MNRAIAAMPKYEAYIDSGIEWLGAIPKNWKIKRFKHYFASAMGATILASDLVDGGLYPVFSATEGDHYFGYVNTRIVSLNQGDLVIPARGNSIGFPKMAKEESTCSQTTIYAKKSKAIDSMFTYYYLLGCKPYLFQFTQTAIPQITVDEVKNNHLVIPTLPEQSAIVNFLDRKTGQLDHAVAIKEQQIALLKERKQILIQNAVTRGLNPDASMRDLGVEWIGEIPTHWKVFSNRALFKERVEPGREGLPLLSVSIHSAVSTEEVADEDNIRGRVKIKDKSKYNRVQPNDVVYNMMRAWQGAIGAVKVEGMVSPAYTIAEPNELMDASFFEYQYRSPIFIQQMDRNSKGITDFRKRLYWDEFKQLMTVVPPVDEQAAIVAHIETESAKIDRAIDLQQQQIEKLKEYKATLINSAVTGKIKVV